MSYAFPPNLEQLIQERMVAGGYQSQDELIWDALCALEEIEHGRRELQTELKRRVGKAGTSQAQPLDREAFRQEARQRRNRDS
jgi:Arc/MetJ-type ribon-helix-helix transcriptional regulator